MKSFLVSPLVWVTLFGLFTGSLFLYLGFTHGTQSEFYHTSGQIDYVYCFKVFASWFILGSVLGLVVYGTYRVVRHVFRRFK